MFARIVAPTWRQVPSQTKRTCRRILPAFRPDPVVDPEFEGFAANVQKLGELTGEETASWHGYLKALAQRRKYFAELGTTATDHGHISAATADLPQSQCESLLAKALSESITPEEAELFRGQMLTEMARMSIEDGMVMQIHPGSYRNHNCGVFKKFGRDKGADIPMRTDYVHAFTVTSITITNGGTGYTTATVSLSGGQDMALSLHSRGAQPIRLNMGILGHSVQAGSAGVMFGNGVQYTYPVARIDGLGCLTWSETNSETQYGKLCQTFTGKLSCCFASASLCFHFWMPGAVPPKARSFSLL